jgi:hypothetical protein
VDMSYLTDPHILLVVCALVVVAVLRYVFRRPPPPKPAAERFTKIQAEARAQGTKDRIRAEADAEKSFKAQQKEEAALWNSSR